MKLTSILEEISVSYNKTDPKSIKLKKYVDIVRESLEWEGAILEAKSISVFAFGNDLEGGNVFLQGSYACGTAVKHNAYEVDADIGFLSSVELDSGARTRIFNTINSRFGSMYHCELRKPCISIDFGDGYKIDLTIYSPDENGRIFFHNSIGGGEEKTISSPKEFVKCMKDYFSLNSYRDIVRLSKHFIKTITSNLEIENCDRIPSVSISIFALKNYPKISGFGSEEQLKVLLIEFIMGFSDFVKANGTNGPDMPEYFVTNTFYKVNNVRNVQKVLDTTIALLNEDNYSQLVRSDVFESIQRRNKVDRTPALTGTMGYGKS